LLIDSCPAGIGVPPVREVYQLMVAPTVETVADAVNGTIGLFSHPVRIGESIIGRSGVSTMVNFTGVLVILGQPPFSDSA
jgi:hypothetical protein